MPNGIIDTATWQSYKNVINTFHKSVGKQTIIWRRLVANVDRYGEGNSKVTVDTPMEVLMGYNDGRTWPTNRLDQQGIRDEESLWLYLNIEHLREQGFLTPNNYLDFNPGLDRFIVQGVEYLGMGDISSSQTDTDPLYILLVLKRDENEVGHALR